MLESDAKSRGLSKAEILRRSMFKHRPVKPLMGDRDVDILFKELVHARISLEDINRRVDQGEPVVDSDFAPISESFRQIKLFLKRFDTPALHRKQKSRRKPKKILR